MAGDRTAGEQEVVGPPEGGGPVATLAALPRMLGAALEDIRTIAHGMSMLPELARLLGGIQQRVEKIEDEMVQMRRSVESVGGEVGKLPARIDDLQDSIPLRRRRR